MKTLDNALQMLHNFHIYNNMLLKNLYTQTPTPQPHTGALFFRSMCLGNFFRFFSYKTYVSFTNDISLIERKLSPSLLRPDV